MTGFTHLGARRLPVGGWTSAWSDGSSGLENMCLEVIACRSGRRELSEGPSVLRFLQRLNRLLYPIF